MSFSSEQHVKQLVILLEKQELTFIAFITALVILKNVQQIAVDAIRNDNELKSFHISYVEIFFQLLYNLSYPKPISCCHIALFFNNNSFVLLLSFHFFFVCLVTLFKKINDYVFLFPFFLFSFSFVDLLSVLLSHDCNLKAFSLDLRMLLMTGKIKKILGRKFMMVNILGEFNLG